MALTLSPSEVVGVGFAVATAGVALASIGSAVARRRAFDQAAAMAPDERGHCFAIARDLANAAGLSNESSLLTILAVTVWEARRRRADATFAQAETLLRRERRAVIALAGRLAPQLDRGELAARMADALVVFAHVRRDCAIGPVRRSPASSAAAAVA